VTSASSLSSTIGRKILSGRTKDQNIGYIAEYLTAIGIDLKEVRVVGDEERHREECAWVPKYPSMREGWRAVAAAIQPLEPRAGSRAAGQRCRHSWQRKCPTCQRSIERW